MNEMMNKDSFTSLELVEVINQYRNKEGNRKELQHYDFLKIVRDEFEEEIGVGNISESSYLNSQNKLQPMFVLTHAQSRQVLVRESKFVRKAVIAYIDKLESQVKNLLPKDYPSALRALANQFEENQALALQIQEQKPLVDFSETVLKSKDNINMETMAKVITDEGLKIGRNRLFEFLREEKILQGNNIPYQTYMERGWFKVTEGVKKTAYGDKIFATTLVTPKGQVKIVSLVKDKYID